MTLNDAAAIVGIPQTPDLRRAKADFIDDADYRMESHDDADALETLGREIGEAIKKAKLPSRSNCHVIGMRGLVGYSETPQAEDLIDALCDQLGPGAEIVRAAAMEASK